MGKKNNVKETVKPSKDTKCGDIAVAGKPKSIKVNSQKDDTKEKLKSPSKGKKAGIRLSPSKATKTKTTNALSVDQEMERLNGEILEEARNLIEGKPSGPSQMTCNSIPVQFIDDNSVLVIRQSEPNKISKKKKKKKKRK